MGRRSGADEKKAKIVEAFCDSVVELGIEGATMGEVAKRVGIDRSTMHYYFSSRHELVRDAVMQAAQYYSSFMEESVSQIDPRDRATSLVDIMFGADFHDDRRSTLISEIWRQGRTDSFFTEQVKSLYEKSEQSVMKVIDQTFPVAPDKERKAIGYAIMQLCEGSTVFTALEFSRTRRLAAKRAALMMLDHLARFDGKSKK